MTIKRLGKAERKSEETLKQLIQHLDGLGPLSNSPTGSTDHQLSASDRRVEAERQDGRLRKLLDIYPFAYLVDVLHRRRLYPSTV